jgi:hypothetical protein
LGAPSCITRIYPGDFHSSNGLEKVLETAPSWVGKPPHRNHWLPAIHVGQNTTSLAVQCKQGLFLRNKNWGINKPDFGDILTIIIPKINTIMGVVSWDILQTDITRISQILA